MSLDDDDLDDGLGPARGIAVAVVATLVVVVIVVALVLLVGCTSSPSPLPPATGSSSSPAATSSSELEAAFDRWWVEGRHVCGEQLALIVDDLAARAVVELDAPALDARLAASGYVYRRCPS